LSGVLAGVVGWVGLGAFFVVVLEGFFGFWCGGVFFFCVFFVFFFFFFDVLFFCFLCCIERDRKGSRRASLPSPSRGIVPSRKMSFLGRYRLDSGTAIFRFRRNDRPGQTFWRFILTKDFQKRVFQQRRNASPPVRRHRKRTPGGAPLLRREMEKKSRRKKRPSRRSTRPRRFGSCITLQEGPQTRVRRVLIGRLPAHATRSDPSRGCTSKSGNRSGKGTSWNRKGVCTNLGVFNRVTIEPQNPSGTDPEKDIAILVEEPSATPWPTAGIRSAEARQHDQPDGGTDTGRSSRNSRGQQAESYRARGLVVLQIAWQHSAGAGFAGVFGAEHLC